MRNLKRERLLAALLASTLSLVSCGIIQTGQTAEAKSYPASQSPGYNARTTPALGH